MKSYNLIIWFLLSISVYGYNNDCSHIGNYQGGKIYMCDENTHQSHDIELNINIKVPINGQIPKVIKSFISPDSNTLNSTNENNTSLHNKKKYNLINSSSIITTPSPTIENAPSPTIESTPSSSLLIAPSPTIESTPSSSLLIAPSPTIESAPSPTIESAPSQDNEDHTLLEDYSIDKSIDSSTKSPSPRLRGKNSTDNKTLHEINKDNTSIIVIISILSTLIVIMTICGIIFFIKFKHSKIDNFNEKKILEKTNASKTNAAKPEAAKTNASKTNASKTNASKPLHRIPKKRNMITKKRRNITNLPPIEEKKIENPIKIVKDISETKTPQSDGLMMLE